MVNVKLISWNGGLIDDPRKLIVLAIKVSTGKVSRKGFEYYIKSYPKEKVSELTKISYKFPSVLEHVVFTFLITDISRVTSHQLVRHRIASYTQESQRYSVVEREFVIPPSLNNQGDTKNEVTKLFNDVINKAFEVYECLIGMGIKPEDARFVLPQAVKTTILMTVNLRELLHIACLRLSKDAQWEIREVVKLMIKEVSRVIPEINHLLSNYCRWDK